MSGPAPRRPAASRSARTVREPAARTRRRAPAAVDAARPGGVDTAPFAVPSQPKPADVPAPAPATATMDKEHFGQCLRRARESRDIALSDIALKTKVARSTLELLEKGELDLLPTGVYARGFIRSFARAVGIDETEPLLLYEKALEARAAAERARSATPVLPVEEAPAVLGLGDDDDGPAPRRGLGLAVFVIILLLIATITLSLLLRRPPASGEGLSLAPARAQTTGSPAC